MIDKAIQYIKHTGGNATLANFIDDHEPIGERLWADLVREGLAENYHGKLRLTPKGSAATTERRGDE